MHGSWFLCTGRLCRGCLYSECSSCSGEYVLAKAIRVLGYNTGRAHHSQIYRFLCRQCSQCQMSMLAADLEDRSGNITQCTCPGSLEPPPHLGSSDGQCQAGFLGPGLQAGLDQLWRLPLTGRNRSVWDAVQMQEGGQSVVGNTDLSWARAGCSGGEQQRATGRRQWIRVSRVTLCVY